jgi:hypothetical protein
MELDLAVDLVADLFFESKRRRSIIVYSYLRLRLAHFLADPDSHFMTREAGMF